ncbi:MAG: hypothetical protein HZB39_11700 [Planctomycetes bacterium]|nr:hypothetical protein [Planctomycetota bacterium]
MTFRLSTIVLASLLCAAAPAQTDNVVSIGAGCTSGIIRPFLGITGTPRPGQTLTFTLSNNYPVGTIVYRNCPLWLGASRTRWGAVILPCNLAPLGSPNCWLYESLDIEAFNTGTAPVQTCSLRIPNDRGLIGAVFHAQWLVPILGGNPWLLTTNAYAITIEP